MGICGKSALFDCGDWTLNANQLRKMRIWENGFLRKMIRLPWNDNGRAIYHIDSSKVFDDTRAEHQIPHMIHAYLDGYIHDTYQQYTSADRHGRNLTNELRQHRNAKWWEWIRRMPYTARQRLPDNPVHETRGNLKQHEDFLNELYKGTGWQDSIIHLTKKQWWNQTRTVLAKWLTENELPPDPRPIPKDYYNDNEDDNKTKKQPTIEEIESEGHNETWHGVSGRFRIITDSLSLQQILSGLNVYHGTTLYNTLFNIDEIIRSWHNKGWKPALTGGTPVEWRNRELNFGADNQCNIVMDTGLNHLILHHATLHNRIWSRKKNFYLQTDGGCRHEGHSATGWRLRTQGLGNSAVTIAEGGTIYNCNMTSLEIEAHAMLEALRFIESQMQEARLTQPPQREPHHHNNTTTTKRPYEPKPTAQQAKQNKTKQNKHHRHQQPT